MESMPWSPWSEVSDASSEIVGCRRWRGAGRVTLREPVQVEIGHRFQGGEVGEILEHRKFGEGQAIHRSRRAGDDEIREEGVRNEGQLAERLEGGQP